VKALWIALVASGVAWSQAKPTTAGAPPSPVSIAALAEAGHCREALRLLKPAMSRETSPELKKRLGIDGAHCAVSLHDGESAEDFVRALRKSFPRDPETLYVAVHVFSELSIQASQELAATAPDSHQLRELTAEGLEAQGKPDDAISEYRDLLKKDPQLRGIHYRIGRLLLSGPNRDAVKEEARREFQDELKVDPSNASAEYVLGELARQDQQTSEAVEHMRRATKLDAGFTDAFIGLGRSLLEGGRVTEALAPLQIAARLEPDNPAAHLYLATAYQRAGRQDDAVREYALQQQAAEKLQRARKGAPPPGK
jgi:predicted Zn-dependent protease